MGILGGFKLLTEKQKYDRQTDRQTDLQTDSVTDMTIPREASASKKECMMLNANS